MQAFLDLNSSLSGSCRNDADEMRLQKLKDLAIELMIDADEMRFQKISFYFSP